jgi:Cys-rich protein (TIGR01571 family)
MALREFTAKSPVKKYNNYFANNIRESPVNNIRESPVNNMSESPVNNMSESSVNISENPMNNMSESPVNNMSESSVNISENPIIVQPLQELRWTTEICDCNYDYCISCEICMCHWCHLSRQYNMLKYKIPEVNIQFCCCICLTDMCVCPCLGTIVTNLKIRGILQQKYGINSLMFIDDILFSIFFPCCTNYQHYREMTIQNENPGVYCTREVRRPFCDACCTCLSVISCLLK